MQTISARELNHHTAQVLAGVRDSGEAVEVTYRGQTYWRIVPARGDDDRLEYLIQSGRATRPRFDRPLLHAPVATKTGLSVEDLLAEIDSDH